MATKQKLPSRHKHPGLFVRAGLINHRKHRHLFCGVGVASSDLSAANYKSNSKAQKVTRAKIVSLNACRLFASESRLSPEVKFGVAATAAALDSPEIPNVVHCGCNWLSSFHIAYWDTLLSRVWTRPGREGISEVRFEGF